MADCIGTIGDIPSHLGTPLRRFAKLNTAKKVGVFATFLSSDPAAIFESSVLMRAASKYWASWNCGTLAKESPWAARFPRPHSDGSKAGAFQNRETRQVSHPQGSDHLEYRARRNRPKPLKWRENEQKGDMICSGHAFLVQRRSTNSPCCWFLRSRLHTMRSSFCDE